MDLFGKTPQEQAMQTLVHDTNRDLSTLRYNTNKIVKFFEENAKKMVESDIKVSEIFVAVEYLKSKTKAIEDDIDEYYKKI